MVEKPKVKIGLGLAKIKGKKKRKKNNSIATTHAPGAAFLVLGEKSNDKKFNVEGDDDDGDEEGGDAAAGKSRAGLLNMEELNGVASSPTIAATVTAVGLGGGFGWG